MHMHMPRRWTARMAGNIGADWVSVTAAGVDADFPEDSSALPTPLSTPDEKPDAQLGGGGAPPDLTLLIPGAITASLPGGNRQAGMFTDRSGPTGIGHGEISNSTQNDQNGEYMRDLKALGVSMFFASGLASAIALSPQRNQSSTTFKLVTVPCEVTASPDRESKGSWQVLLPPEDDDSGVSFRSQREACLIVPNDSQIDSCLDAIASQPQTPSSTHGLMGTPTSTGCGDEPESPITERLREYVQAYVALYPEITNMRTLETILEDEARSRTTSMATSLALSQRVASDVEDDDDEGSDSEMTIRPGAGSPMTMSSIYSFHTAIAGPPSPVCSRSSRGEINWRGRA